MRKCKFEVTDRVTLILEGESATVECDADDPFAMAQADAVMSMLRLQGGELCGAEIEDERGTHNLLRHVAAVN